MSEIINRIAGRFTNVNLEDVDMKDGSVKAHVNFSRFNGRFKEAQVWLDNQINQDMMPYVPFKTGAMQTEVMRRNNTNRGTGQICVYALPYGKAVYEGISKSGKQMRYSNPLTTPRYFENVKAIYKVNWVQGVKEIITRK